ncbi:hypothetical protein GWK47_035511 [Chionoecetes opilio]|uniref:Uncharacterized protein n=1 Tax=Chionoecetes opilio TaxID=41210 RepID=A0A8J4YF88_CHIOP|nr:hypothetical protein GWK47_035511 [Chionoecetes opilio]
MGPKKFLAVELLKGGAQSSAGEESTGSQKGRKSRLERSGAPHLRLTCRFMLPAFPPLHPQLRLRRKGQADELLREIPQWCCSFPRWGLQKKWRNWWCCISGGFSWVWGRVAEFGPPLGAGTTFQAEGTTNPNTPVAFFPPFAVSLKLASEDPNP